MYKIIFSKSSEKEFLSLENELQMRISSILLRITINPKNYIARLSGLDLYKLRVGNYRIILDLDEEKKEILIHKIGHRKNIYDF
ncbi:MAG: type II toxin-antitoxin system RelE/ParE family toxin [Candidatus Micrarchaeia archaeon]|jgi:mRNA interferase RelE/StbE